MGTSQDRVRTASDSHSPYDYGYYEYRGPGSTYGHVELSEGGSSCHPDHLLRNSPSYRLYNGNTIDVLYRYTLDSIFKSTYWDLRYGNYTDWGTVCRGW